MTTDHELLELAAKAAGSEFWYGEPLKQFMDRSNGNRQWNPLTDDGDALRLAVTLNLFTGVDFYHFRSLERFARQDSDEYVATRRAVVRAAAAIGEAK